jgi:hypothetical protein
MKEQQEPVEITCPRNPDHGPAVRRWLPRSEREKITKAEVADVYEVDCPKCGRFEWAGSTFE